MACIFFSGSGLTRCYLTLFTPKWALTSQFFSSLLTLAVPGMLGVFSLTLQKEPRTSKLTEHPLIG